MKTIYSRIRSLIIKRKIIKILIAKDLQNRYSNTILGLSWAVITPLLISLTIAFVFSYILKSGVTNFTAFVISGMLPWLCFAASLQEASVSLNENASLMRQFMVPLDFIPMARVLINFLNLTIGFLVAAIFFMRSLPQFLNLILFLPVALVLHFLFTLGMAFFIAPLYTYRKDTGYVLNIALLFWLWATPVFYFLDNFPEGIRSILSANIMIPFLNLYRSIFYQGVYFDYKDLGKAALLAALSFCCGYAFFIRQEQRLKKIL